MPKPYSLTLFSLRKPADPSGIRMSVQMIAYCLWEQFSNLPHVTLQYHESEDAAAIPAGDFALIHDYFASAIYQRLPEIRAKTGQKIMGIMESCFESPLIDRAFTFLPIPWGKCEQIQLPCPQALLDANYSSQKMAGSVLLDHSWIEGGTPTDLCAKLYSWLSWSRIIAQLRRSGHESLEPPSWVQSIPESNYPAYLEATKQYETFILTHPGSYEHSIIDMAARGIRVLVPTVNGRPFCHPSIIEDLNLATFSTQSELLNLLDDLPRPSPLDRFTDMPAIAAKIDAYCQGVLV